MDHISNNKVLGVYSFNDEILNKKDEILFEKNNTLIKNDLVIISDWAWFNFKKIAKLICKRLNILH